jgi:hypothetical protein
MNKKETLWSSEDELGYQMGDMNGEWQKPQSNLPTLKGIRLMLMEDVDMGIITMEKAKQIEEEYLKKIK